ncbi:unnamed protein product [Polarella glacialis]|uniref:Uncharacterized protein n=1 Tax=Polarella glacialis TaxID=89957 RepID=A0A813FBN1_POLGL|nr:unnamed protein product [Polarella glacialis]
MGCMVLLTLTAMMVTASLVPVGTLTSPSIPTARQQRVRPILWAVLQLHMSFAWTTIPQMPFCFDPLRSFRFDNVFGNVTTGPGEGVTATSYLQYVDLMQSQTITQNSQNPAFVGVWTTLFPSTVNGIFSLSLTVFAQHQHKHRQNHKNRRNRQWQHDKHRTALAQDQDRPSHHHKQHKQHKQRKQHQRKSSGCQVAIARTTITVLQQVHTSTTHVIR